MDKQESLILESVLTGIIIIDAKTLEILDLNTAACEMAGYTKDEIIGMTCADTVCVREHADCPMLAQGKSMDRAETTLRKKDGSLVQILKSAKQVKIDNRDCIIESFHDITEQKNMENALRLSAQESRENSEFLKIVIDSLPHPFYVINPDDYSIIMANTASGADAEAGKQTCHKLTHQSDLPCSSEEHPCPLEEVKKSRKPFVAEHRHYDKDGNPIIVEVHGFPILDKDGSLLHMIEYSMNITERKGSEKALIMNEATIRIMTEQAPIGIGILDKNGNVIQVFGTWLEIFGMSDVADSLKVNLFAGPIIPEDKKQDLMEGNSIKYDSPFDFSWVHAANAYKCSRTGIVHLETSITPMKSGKERAINQYLVLVQDNTESKEKEAALQKSEASLNATGRIAKVGGWEIDVATSEVNWTEETYRIHEVPLDQKASFADAINYFHPEERETLRTAIQRAMDYGESYDMELRFISAKGKELWTHTTCEPVVVDGKTIKLVGTFQDITERKQAEVSLKQSEERYRRLVDVLPEGVIVGDEKETIMMVNKAMGEILGIDSNDLVGRNLMDFIDPRYVSQIKSQTKRRLSGTRSSYDVRMIRADGEPRDVHISAIPQLNTQNKIEGAIGVISDITDQKKMEKDLRATSYELRERMKESTAVSATSDLMKDIDVPLETVLKDIIPILSTGFQYPEIVCGRIFIDDLEVTSSNYNNPVATISDEILISGMRVGGIEIGYLKPRPESDEGPFFNQEVSMVNQISVDLSQFIERQRTQQEILQQSAKLDAVTRSTLDAIIMMDQEGLVQFWNPASEQIFGYSEKEMLGQNLHKIILPSKYMDAHSVGFEKFRQTGTGAAIGKVLELSGLRKNGSEFPVELALTSIRLEDGWGSVGIIRDITERKQNEQELLQHQKELEIYTSLLSHDLNNDLSAIVGSLEIMQMVLKDDPVEAQQFLDSSLAVTVRMSNLLSAMSRTQNLQDEPIGNMIREVAKLSVDAKIGLEIQVKVEDKLEDAKFSGGRLLPMVFENLFRNAVQHVGESPKITVDLSAIEHQARIVVSDNGPGVPDDIRDQLFERGTSTKEGGGLGLHLSKTIIEAAGGSIELMPKKKNTGAQFEIMLSLIK